MVEGLKGLGATQLAGGQAAEAMATWRRAVMIGERLRSTSSEPLYCLAGCHALLGGAVGVAGTGPSGEEGPALLDRAMGTLRRAVDVGYRTATGCGAIRTSTRYGRGPTFGS